MSKKIGPREQQLREMRAQGKLSKAHEMMLDDGAPLACIRLPEKAKPTTKTAPPKGDVGVTLAPPLAVQKALEKELADDLPPQAQDDPVAATKENEVVRTKSKKAAKAKSRTAVKSKTTKAVRSGERSPAAVGEYIAKHKPTMDQLSKHFKMEAHPLRAKMTVARGQGFKIEYDSKEKRYSATAPKAKTA